MQMIMETGYAKETLYIYEPESYTPLARIDRPTRSAANDSGSVYWYHATPNGLPEELTDRDGQIIWQARYHSWGNLALETRPDPATPGQELHDNLRHAGQYHDRETGLFYNTFRYFDPDIGRFTTEDPIGLAGGHNLYQYAPNPFAWIDPWGWNKNSNSEMGNWKIYDIYTDKTKTERVKVGIADNDRRHQGARTAKRTNDSLRKAQKKYPNAVAIEREGVYRTTKGKMKRIEAKQVGILRNQGHALPGNREKQRMYHANSKPRTNKGPGRC